jgi:arylsulfatase A-like enzyme
VLIVVVDDVGVEQLGPWGIGPLPAHTPTIDCLCRRGVRFTQAYATPMCSPTRAEILTGNKAIEYGLGAYLNPHPDVPYELPPTDTSLPVLASEAGYRTGLLGKWHVATALGPGAATHPNRFGFEHFSGSMANLNATANGTNRDFGYGVWEKVVDGHALVTTTYPTTANVDDALRFIDAAQGDPWMVVLSFNAPHIPLHQPPRALLDANVQGFDDDHTQYLAMVEAADAELGRLLHALDPQELADTTVFVLADNGTKTALIPPSLGRLEGKATVHEAGVRVPLVVSGLGVPRPGVSDALVASIDLLPTAVELMGMPAPEGIDGRSFLATLSDPSRPAHEVVTAASFQNHTVPMQGLSQMARNASHKLIADPDREYLHEVGPSTLNEGPNLLDGPLTTDEQAQLAELRRALVGADGGPYAPGP